MPKLTIDREVLHDPSWWHWAATIPLLAAGLAGIPWAIPVAMMLCAIMALYYFVELKELRPMPVQVRLAFFGLLAAGALPWMQWLHWVQLLGTTAMVTVGYCPLIRMLSLTSMNRTEPLTRSLVWRVFVHQPCAGGLVRWPDNSVSSGPSCSLASKSHTVCSLRARES